MSKMPKPAAKAVAVKVVRLPHGHGLPLPAYQTPASAGLDLLAAIAGDKPVTIMPGAFAMVPTGLTLALPAGTEAQVRPRSGLAAKHGVTVLNSPGTIDADYRGEVAVLLINHGQKPFVVRRGDRIAQMVIATLARVHLAEAASLTVTVRGTGGFGSTGVAEDAKRKRIAAEQPVKKPARRASPPAKKR